MSRYQLDAAVAAAGCGSPFVEGEENIHDDSFVNTARSSVIDLVSPFAGFEGAGAASDPDDEARLEGLTIEPDYALEDEEDLDEQLELEDTEAATAFEEEPYDSELDEEGAVEVDDEVPDILNIEEDESEASDGLRNRIIAAAEAEVARWGNGRRKETETSMHPILRQYWQNLGLSRSRADAKIQARSAWSAAFISYVLTQAGLASFKKSGAHYVYIAAAKRSRIRNDSHPYWAYRVTEVAPQPGDIVCRSRKPPKSKQCSPVSYDTVDNGNYWPTHGDIVVEVLPDAIRVVGGNVDQSARDKTIALGPRGFLPEQPRTGCRYIAVLRLRDLATSVEPSPFGVATTGGAAPAGLTALPRRIVEMVRTGVLSVNVAAAIAAGERDVVKLTSMLFFLRHPERRGARIRPEERQLAQEWLDIRDRIIKPVVAMLSPGGASTIHQPSTGASKPKPVSSSLGRMLTDIKAAPAIHISPRTRKAIVEGYERVEPRGDVWCQQAGLSLDEGALARMIASEVGSKPPQYMLAVAEATINEAKAKHISVFQRVTMQGLKVRGQPARSAGYFGRQSGRWCSSLQDPTQRHLHAARAALASATPLIARDARRWIDGKVMDGGVQAGKKLRYDAVTIVEKWGSEGWEWIGPVTAADATPLIDPYRLMLLQFVGRGKANVHRGVEGMQDGRRRWKTPQHEQLVRESTP